METRILFSCVGNTDPMNQNNLHDGPILHIIRNYRPAKVYLYLSRQMLKCHREENRYEPYIQNLAEREGFEIEIERIERSELVDVHLFDILFRDFRTLIEDIHKQYPQAQILLNASSGTPGMKSALSTLSTFMDFPTTVVQVATPKTGTHDTPKDVDENFWDLLWEMNEDNHRNSKRCIELKNPNLNYEIKSGIIANLIDSYDYDAAYDIALSIRDLLDPKALEYLRAQKYRKNLDFEKAEAGLKHIKKKDLLTIEHREYRNIFEYFLKWQSDLRVGDYRAFMIEISPLLAGLQRRIIEKYYPEQPRIKDDATWEKQKFCEPIEKLLHGQFSGFAGELRAWQINALLKKLPKIPSEITKRLVDLRSVEERRNRFAHQIIKISKEDLEGRMKQLDFIVNDAWYLVNELCEFSSTSEQIFKNAYDEVNKKIKASL
ncbi:CRISPR type III-A/MTUBE-associated protein Csm6 [Aedoeadaptatus ivorii]|uniref:CRISPR type III-A/MTUBE-associated protein Csm6 n=1 Tax=Aedoeadaptatus ivorii TaxID=54006 RepID=A0A3S5F7S8_9FIRM|nr:hypothetical protein [Peptoniphilus ivorii]VEJ34626.1 CRISPR type III-A/MTUBE-associated protein Csm6 [Peptoniphilus ivorii]